jgi:hypothetical protein
MLERKIEEPTAHCSVMHLIVQSCEQAISKKDKLFKRLSRIDLAGKTNDLQDLDLIANSFPLTKARVR